MGPNSTPRQASYHHLDDIASALTVSGWLGLIEIHVTIPPTGGVPSCNAVLPTSATIPTRRSRSSPCVPAARHILITDCHQNRGRSEINRSAAASTRG